MIVKLIKKYQNNMFIFYMLCVIEAKDIINVIKPC